MTQRYDITTLSHFIINIKHLLIKMKVSVFAGKDIAIDDFLPFDLPEYLERAKTVANDPVAVAEWFHTVVSAVSLH